MFIYLFLRRIFSYKGEVCVCLSVCVWGGGVSLYAYM